MCCMLHVVYTKCMLKRLWTPVVSCQVQCLSAQSWCVSTDREICDRAEGAARETAEEANAATDIAAPYAHLDIPVIGQVRLKIKSVSLRCGCV